MPGKFITFEGGEGTGKSTQAERLVARLAASGRTVLSTREPGGTPFAERVRDLVLSAVEERSVLAEALLFAAARADHVARAIAPALGRGDWVVCDRFADSTRAYQGVAGGLAESTVDTLEAMAVADTRPDLTIILDVPVAVGLARAAQRRDGARIEADAFEARRVAFHESLRQGFLAIADRETNRCVVIDATGGPDAISDAVWAVVQARLLGGQG